MRFCEAISKKYFVNMRVGCRDFSVSISLCRYHVDVCYVSRQILTYCVDAKCSRSRSIASSGGKGSPLCK